MDKIVFRNKLLLIKKLWEGTCWKWGGKNRNIL